jgi:hypothetical protein
MQTDEWPGFQGNPAAETAREIELTRRQPGATGEVLWRAAFLMRNPGGIGAALAGSYSAPALVPASPWLGRQAPGKPLLTVHRTGREISVGWKPAGGEPVWQWLLQEQFGENWRAEILPAGQTSRFFSVGSGAALPQAVAVTAVSRIGNLSPPAVSNLEMR